MFDPLGVKKEPESALPAEATSSRTVFSRLQSKPWVWMSLMFVDILLMIVFGGFMGSTIFAHLTAPAKAPAAAQVKERKFTVPPSDTPRPPEPGVESPKTATSPSTPPESTSAAAPTTPAAAPAEAKVNEPVKKAPPKEKEEAAKPLPKPSLLAAPPAQRPPPKASLAASDPKPQTQPAKPAAKKETSAAAPAPDATVKVKASAVEFKIHAPSAKQVALAGAFLVKGGKKDMMEDGTGHWLLTIYLKPGSYRYHFIIDGKKTLDTDNPKIDRGASVLVVP